MPETLNGFIERVTYHNPENGFAVLKVKVKGREELVSVIGSTTSVTAGEHVDDRDYPSLLDLDTPAAFQTPLHDDFLAIELLRRLAELSILSKVQFPGDAFRRDRRTSRLTANGNDAGTKRANDHDVDGILGGGEGHC